jgi:23S rRNA (guanine2445-N2)-methyltransferase / 23S rRNA (guanine2069-N7)-methyltransferase
LPMAPSLPGVYKAPMSNAPKSNAASLELFAAAAHGTEEVCAQELTAIGAGDVETTPGGVRFSGSLETALRACLWSRTATRVVLVLGHFPAADKDELYSGIAEIPWEDHLAPSGTMSVDAISRRSSLSHERFVAQRTKDGVVDRLRRLSGRRPNVDRERPDVLLHLHLHKDLATVGVDLSGGGLHRRGITRTPGPAPLKESLAASMLMLAEWPEAATSGMALLDPMCGSGTILVEAAWMATDRAPGLTRRRWGHTHWLGQDAKLWRRLLEEARDRAHEGAKHEIRLFGADRSAEALEVARDNLGRAGVACLLGGEGERREGACASLEQREIYDARPPIEGGGLVVMNPPYGARLGEEAEMGPLYATIGDVLRHRFGGWTANVLVGSRDLARQIGLKPTRRHVLFNGPIECRMLSIPISTAPVASDDGPGWRKPGPDAEMLRNRLKKKLKRLSRWAKKSDLTCYRVYDRDVPEYNVSIDRYGGAVLVSEYEPPRRVDQARSEQHRRDVLLVVSDLMGVEERDIHLRLRLRRGPRDRSEVRARTGAVHEVVERGLRFEVNLGDYLDTGIFLDQRQIRDWIRERSDGARFLNLFAYTCTATAHAVAGGAAHTTSVDLSRTYLDWGRRNLELNDLAGDEHLFVRADCLPWLRRTDERFDLVYVAPPTWSASHDAHDEFDLQRDYGHLLGACASVLAPGGRMVFSTGSWSFEPDARFLSHLGFEERSDALCPEDFKASRAKPRIWVSKAAAARPARN